MSNKEIKEKIARLKKEKYRQLQILWEILIILQKRLQQYLKMQFYSVEFHSWEKVQRF